MKKMDGMDAIEGLVCPVCGREYSSHPALSRVDNRTYICPECGQREALAAIGIVDREEQDKVIRLARAFQ